LFLNILAEESFHPVYMFVSHCNAWINLAVFGLNKGPHALV